VPLPKVPERVRYRSVQFVPYRWRTVSTRHGKYVFPDRKYVYP
jgi:hypothetical protein